MSRASKRAHNTEEQNKQLRGEYRSLKKATKEKEPEILTLREPTFREFIEKGNLLGQRVDTVGIAVEDVQQVRRMAEYGAQIGRTVEKESVRIFSPDELVESISRLYSKYDSSEGEIDWTKIGRLAEGYMRTVPSVTFMNGPLLADFVIKPRKAKEALERKEPEALVKVQQVDGSKEEKTMTDERCREMAARLNEVKEMGYFEFVINPDSYTQTVENMYDLSYLVKVSNAGIALKDGELPTVKPMVKPRKETWEAGLMSNQCIFSITKRQWAELKHVLNIKKSFLPHRAENEDAIEESEAF